MLGLILLLGSVHTEDITSRLLRNAPTRREACLRKQREGAYPWTSVAQLEPTFKPEKIVTACHLLLSGPLDKAFCMSHRFDNKYNKSGANAV